MTYKPTQLSPEAFEELKNITKDEIAEPMSDDEIEAMGVRLLRFFSILATPVPEIKPTQIEPTEQEQNALDFITEESKQGRSPSVRQLARAMGFKSSRSGHKLINRLISKGLVDKR